MQIKTYKGITVRNVGISWYFEDRHIGTSFAEAKRAINAMLDRTVKENWKMPETYRCG